MILKRDQILSKKKSRKRKKKKGGQPPSSVGPWPLAGSLRQIVGSRLFIKNFALSIFDGGIEAHHGGDG